MVGVERFELPTSCSQSRRATGLRYTPKDLKQHTLNKAVLMLDLSFKVVYSDDFAPLVPRGGIEPPRGCPHQILSLARLPVSSPRQNKNSLLVLQPHD